MGKLENNKQQKRTSLLDTAFKLFTTQGVSKTSIAEISQKAGIAKGTFYLYFKDKYDIRNKLASSKTVQAKFYANYRGSGFYQSRTHKLSFEDTVEWSSSNPKVAAVDEKGVVTGVSAGTAKITAKCGVFEESRTIQVTGDAKVQVKKITGVPKKKTLKKGKKWSIKAKVTPKNVAKLTYKSSDKKVASVNGKGVVKAKKKGKATITIKAGSLKKTCKITVK